MLFHVIDQFLFQIPDDVQIVFFFFCLSGHTEDRCWKKNGYPKGNDKKKMAVVALDNNINDMACESEGKAKNYVMADLSSEQRNQLVKLLNQIQIQIQNLKQSGNHGESSANCAGPFFEEASEVW
ncbi:hypothetical protein L6452_14890 [Arctium lappa]|uniref:Uncharacterized protein n=1 Tax=Arctium lappa TaxID=4217 RepID=A0ACB9CMA3_ARCLA|nr:hypothetical protein L6452_14890 [Arctium lappa]